MLLGIALSGIAARAQNSCSNAVPIVAGTYTIDQVNGNEIPVPLCNNNDVGALHTEWYSYTAAADLSLTISTDLPQNAGRDTRFNVYGGTCGQLSCVGGADDQDGNTRATATVQVSSGLTYRIAFDDRWENNGFDFELTEGPPVVTEFSFSPVAINVSGSILGAADMTGDMLDDVVGVTGNNVSLAKQLAGGGFATVNIPTAMAAYPASWSMAIGDLNGDGYNDLEYGNGSGVSLMLSANNGTSFTEFHVSQYVFSQRTNMVDINNDGLLDGFVCHDTQANVFYMNNGDGTFDFAQGGLGETCGNYGSVWIDYDNDHDMDLFVAKCGCDPVDILYRNNGDGTYTNVAPALGLADSHSSWSSAWGDYDNDGDMDLFIVNTPFLPGSVGNVRLFINHEGERHHWAKFRMVGRLRNVFAIGAQLDIRSAEIWQSKEVIAGSNFKAQNDLTLHFGLGDATLVDEMEARWPGQGGVVERRLTGYRADRTWAIYPPERLGDVGGDGRVGSNDLFAFLTCFFASTGPVEVGCEIFDMDSNGQVTSNDFFLLLDRLFR